MSIQFGEKSLSDKVGCNLMKYLWIILVAALLLIGCEPVGNSPNEDVSPIEIKMYSPQPEDGDLVKGKVYLKSTEIKLVNNDPSQREVVLTGTLPTPCHNLRAIVGSPEFNNRISIELYSLVSPTAICTQELKAFFVNLPLGSLSEGHYILFVNGGKKVEFDR